MMGYERTEQAKGFSEYPNSGNVKIAVTVPRHDFEFMKAKAIKDGLTIADVMRQYIETGILVDKEIDEMDDPVTNGDGT